MAKVSGGSAGRLDFDAMMAKLEKNNEEKNFKAAITDGVKKPQEAINNLVQKV